MSFEARAALVLSAVACAAVACSGAGKDEGLLGQATLAITTVPSDVQCIQLTAQGASQTSVQAFDVTPGSSSVFQDVTGLPLGSVTFSANAFNSPCSGVTSSSPADWVSDPDVTTLTSGVVANIVLSMHRPGQATVGVDFPSGSGGAGGSSSSSSGFGGTYSGPPPTPPQIVNAGGPVLSSPQIYPVFFSNDDPSTVASLANFSLNVGASAYWTATTSEYGVGPATGHAAINVAETAPTTIDDATIQQWIASHFSGENSSFPQADANTLVVLYYPLTTTVTNASGQASCQDFIAYHDSVQVGSTQVAYAVVPRCAAVGPVTGLNAVTSAASQVLIDAATDPQPQVAPAYAQVDTPDIYWGLLLLGGEPADMCSVLPNASIQVPSFKYMVQRSWSNQAALAGHDPCQPAPAGEVYINAAPVLPDTANINGIGTVKAVKIPVGQSRTIPVELFSDAPTGAWTVSAYDWNAFSGGGPSLLDLQLDKTTGTSGDVLDLTISVQQAGQFGFQPFVLVSRSGSQTSYWIGAVAP